MEQNGAGTEKEWRRNGVGREQNGVETEQKGEGMEQNGEGTEQNEAGTEQERSRMEPAALAIPGEQLGPSTNSYQAPKPTPHRRHRISSVCPPGAQV